MKFLHDLRHDVRALKLWLREVEEYRPASIREQLDEIISLLKER